MKDNKLVFILILFSGDLLFDSSSFRSGECVKDDPRNPVLSDATMSSNDMTIEACRDFCQIYQYYGVENGYDCYCGNSHSPLHIVKDQECNVACPGDLGEFCGGFRKMQIYSRDYAQYVNFAFDAEGDCYADVNDQSALIDYSETIDQLTQEICQATCETKGLAEDS